MSRKSSGQWCSKVKDLLIGGRGKRVAKERPQKQKGERGSGRATFFFGQREWKKGETAHAAREKGKCI